MKIKYTLFVLTILEYVNSLKLLNIYAYLRIAFFYKSNTQLFCVHMASSITEIQRVYPFNKKLTTAVALELYFKNRNIDIGAISNEFKVIHT